MLVACFGLALCAVPAHARAQERRQSARGAERTLLSSPAPPAQRRPARQRLGRSKRLSAAGGRQGVLSRFLSNPGLAASILTSQVASLTSEVARGGAAERAKAYEDPKMRLNWFLFQRTFPADTLPSKGRFNAFSDVSLLPSGQPSPETTLPTERWRHVGPSPIAPKFSSMGVTSGRVSAIAVSPANPRVVLVGGATGGIWRSTDSGDTFAPVSDNQVDLAVGSLAFAPSNPSIVYAGMGDTAGGYMGTGVLKSLDGGQSWFLVSDHTLPAPGTISDIVVDRADPERVYLTQYSYRAVNGQGEVYASGFFFSEDGGRSWTKTFTGLPRDLVAHPTEPRTLYLSMSSTFSQVTPSAGVYKSTDGGENWDVIFTPAFLDATEAKVAVTPAEPETIYVYAGLVLKDSAQVSVHVSRDGGRNWSDLGHGEVDIGQLGYNSYISVNPTDGRKVYIGTRDLYKSTDGGVTWANLTQNWRKFATAYEFFPDQALAHSDQHVLSFSPADPNVIYIGNDGGVSRSRDGGESFESLNATLGLTQFNSITLHPSDADTSCGGTQDNGVLVRSPGLARWSEFESGDSGRCLMDPRDPRTIYSSYVYGSVFRFRNNGGALDGGVSTIATEATFQEPKPEDGARIGFYPAFAIDPSNGYLYFGTWRLFVSKDQGNLWTRTAGVTDLTKGETDYGSDVLTAIGIGPAGSNVIYTGSAQGRLMLSKTAGKTWKDTGGIPRRFITSIVVSPSDAAKAYVTVSGFGSGHVFRTTDSGAKWDDISQKLCNIPVNALLIDPLSAETLYAGTDIGVFRSTDDGTSWVRFNNGLPPVIVTGFSAQPSGTIQASTYGRGVYQLDR
jgi:photosystem II stability/assembly factor-like uncharacterized protein